MIEAMAQAAGLLLLGDSEDRNGLGIQLRGVNGAKFRRHVIPGDQLKLVVTLGAARGPLVKAAALAEVDGQAIVGAVAARRPADRVPIRPRRFLRPRWLARAR